MGRKSIRFKIYLFFILFLLIVACFFIAKFILIPNYYNKKFNNAINSYFVGDPYCGDKNFSTIFLQYKEKASAGDSHSMFIVGIAYLYGVGVKQDLKQGNVWINNAALANNADAKVMQAILLLNQPLSKTTQANILQKTKMAEKILSSSASQGNKLAKYILAIFYLSTDKETNSIQILKNLARNFGPAQFSLAEIYNSGLYSIGNAESITRLYEAAINNSTTPNTMKYRSMLRLSEIYYKGNDSKLNEKKSLYWKEKADSFFKKNLSCINSKK